MMARPYKQRLIDELREHVRHAVPFDLVFKPTARLTDSEKARLEASLKEAFELWADTWVYPWIDRIEEALCKRAISRAKG